MLAPLVQMAIKAHARRAYPEEACGFLMSNDGAQFYMPRRNVHRDPRAAFRIAPQAWLAAKRQGEIIALVHSHPDGPDCPSEADMMQQQASGLPWVIVSTDGRACLEPFAFGDHLPIPPLIGRPARHGVTDCMCLIRDWYRLERGITIVNFPRSWEWWKNGGNLYLDQYAKNGFRLLESGEAIEVGDVFLAQVRSPVPNHGGVYIGNGLALHHLMSRLPADKSRLSKRDPIPRWRKYITHWLRYAPDS